MSKMVFPPPYQIFLDFLYIIILGDRHENSVIDGKYSEIVEIWLVSVIREEVIGLFRLLVAGQ